MKTLIGIMMAVMILFTGCRTTAKLIASASVTVDHALNTWAIYEADGKATDQQKIGVREAQAKYYAAEDAVLQANIAFQKDKDKTKLKQAELYFQQQQQNLLNLIKLFTGKATV